MLKVLMVGEVLRGIEVPKDTQDIKVLKEEQVILDIKVELEVKVLKVGVVPKDI